MSEHKYAVYLWIVLGVLVIVAAVCVVCWMDSRGYWVFPQFHPIDNGTPPDMLPNLPVHM